jgi:hypothetical protein
MTMRTYVKAFGLGLIAAAPMSAQAPLGLFDWGTELVDWTQTMITNFGGLFVRDGIIELAVLSALMVMWAWFQWGLNRALTFSHHAHYPLPIPQIVMIFLKTAVILYLLNHYMVNFPGVGFSFHSWPMAVAKHMTLQLDNGPGSAKEQLMLIIQTPTNMIDKPINPLAILDNFVFLQVVLLTGVLSFLMFVLGGLAFVISGVFTVLGPYLIPLWLLGGRPASWAWNWLQVMLAVASYRAIGSAMEFVMANMWLYFLNNGIGADTSIANWISHLGVCLFLTLFFILATTMVPLFAAQIFNGAGAIAQAATSAVAGVATRFIR